MYSNPTQQTPLIKQEDANKNREIMQLANLINYNSGGGSSGGGGGGNSSGLSGLAEQFMGEGSLLGGSAAGLGSFTGSSGSGALTGAGGSLAGTGGSALTGGTATGGTAASGSAAGGSGLGALGWAAALAAVIGGNEKQAIDKGARDEDERQYWEDLFTGEVLQDDIRHRWGDKVFGDNTYGFGGDVLFGAQLSQGDLQEAWKTFKNESTVARILGRKKDDDGKEWTEY